MFDWFYNIALETGNAVVSTWIGVIVAIAAVVALSKVFSQVKKIQGRKLRWQTLRHELMWSALNVACTALALKYVSAAFVAQGWLVTDATPVAWYVVAMEFALFFFVFDLYFYIIHRTVHIEPLYSWIHRIHHRSIAPNPLSSTSMTPVEGILEGLIIPIFLSVFTVHETSLLFIIPFATLMGLYVHCGYEMVPKWWYSNRLTRWLISPMFHDQHHQYVTCNYGAFTTIWDRVFDTVRPKFLADFNRLKGNTATETVAEASN